MCNYILYCDKITIWHIFFLQWPGKLAAAFHLLQIPDPALHIEKKPLLPVNVNFSFNITKTVSVCVSLKAKCMCICKK